MEPRYNEGPRPVAKFVRYSEVSFFTYFLIRGGTRSLYRGLRYIRGGIGAIFTPEQHVMSMDILLAGLNPQDPGIDKNYKRKETAERNSSM